MTIIHNRRFWLGMALSISLLAILVIIVLTPADKNNIPEGTTFAGMTISPLFNDPRLDSPLAVADNATIPPLDLQTTIANIQGEFNATQGIQNCTAYLWRPSALRANCTVNDGYNRIEMAELLRLLAFRHLESQQLWVTLNDHAISMTYVWENALGYWGLKPEHHPTFDDPRLFLIIAYNPAPNMILTATVPPSTPDPRPHVERVEAFFEDTPHVESCIVIFSHDEVSQGYWYNNKHIDAHCIVDAGFNTPEMAEWLRRLANRSFINSNVITCESMGGCNAQLNQLSMSIILNDDNSETAYHWEITSEYWTIEESIE